MLDYPRVMSNAGEAAHRRQIVTIACSIVPTTKFPIRTGRATSEPFLIRARDSEVVVGVCFKYTYTYTYAVRTDSVELPTPET